MEVIAILGLIALVGIGGIFITQRWFRFVLWALAALLACFGMYGLANGGLSEPFTPSQMRVFCAVVFWPAVGCLLGELWARVKKWMMTFVIHSDLYVSRDKDAAMYDRTPILFTERVEYKGLTTFELAKLWAALRERRIDVSKVGFPCVLQKIDGGRFIHRLPDEMIEDLSRLQPDRFADVVTKWISAGAWGWSKERARPVLEDLVRLSRRAMDSGRYVYLWNCEGERRKG